MLFQRCLDRLHEVAPFLLQTVEIGAEGALEGIENTVRRRPSRAPSCPSSACATGR